MLVGYKLIRDEDGATVQTWGGIWGQCPSVPNPVFLPNGAHVHAPSLGVSYGGYTIVEWDMEPPAPTVPDEVSPYQARIALLNAGLLGTVESMMADPSTAQEARIAWEYATAIRRQSPFIAVLGPALGLTDEQIDGLFLAAKAVQ